MPPGDDALAGRVARAPRRDRAPRPPVRRRRRRRRGARTPLRQAARRAHDRARRHPADVRDRGRARDDGAEAATVSARRPRRPRRPRPGDGAAGDDAAPFMCLAHGGQNLDAKGGATLEAYPRLQRLDDLRAAAQWQSARPRQWRAGNGNTHGVTAPTGSQWRGSTSARGGTCPARSTRRGNGTRRRAGGGRSMDVGAPLRAGASRRAVKLRVRVLDGGWTPRPRSPTRPSCRARRRRHRARRRRPRAAYAARGGARARTARARRGRGRSATIERMPACRGRRRALQVAPAALGRRPDLHRPRGARARGDVHAADGRLRAHEVRAEAARRGRRRERRERPPLARRR